MLSTIAEDLQVIRKAESGYAQVTWVGEGVDITYVTLRQARSALGTSVILAFFVVTLPLLGAFTSHVKGRGIAEGYDLVTFFGPIGLVVALCLPSNPRRP
jgi:hypothetical protein